MTEAEWLACDDPGPMLEFLRGKASGRKLRLFAVACCRRVARLLDTPYTRNTPAALDVFERHADGLAKAAAARAGGDARDASLADAPPNGLLHYAARRAADAVCFLGPRARTDPAEIAALASSLTAEAGAVGAAADAAPGDWEGRQADVEEVEATVMETEDYVNAHRAARDEQCDLLRDLFGNPFRPVRIAPAGLAWNGGTVPKLAQAIYDGRAFDRLPVLADALEDAGCADPDLLGHLRGPGPHVRGCWAVDLLLGRE